MPTNDPEYMKNYQRWRRNPSKYPKPIKRPLFISLSRKEVEFLKRLIRKATARRTITQDESEEANSILYKY